MPRSKGDLRLFVW